MRCREDDVAHDVIRLHFRATYTTTTTALRAERVGRNGLDVLSLRHHDDELFVVNQVFNTHFTNISGNFAHAWSCKCFANCGEFFGDNRTQFRVGVED